MKKFCTKIVLVLFLCGILPFFSSNVESWTYVDAQKRSYIGVTETTATAPINAYWLKFPAGWVSISNEVATIAGVGGGGLWSTGAGSIIYYSAGNVGIGTSTPGQSLDVHGIVTFNPNNDGVNEHTFSGSTGSGWYEIRNSSGTATISLKSSGISYFTGGNFGIGTSNPDVSLHSELDDAVNNGVTNVLRLTHTTTGTPAANIGVGIGFEAETSASNNEIIAAIEAYAPTVTAGSEMGSLAFKTMNTGAAADTKMVIQGSGAVGIGTTNPGARLHVEHNALIPCKFQRTITSVSGAAHVASIYLKTSNDMIDTFGPSLRFDVEDATSGTDKLMGYIAAARDGADTEGGFDFYAGTNGSEKFLSIRATGYVNVAQALGCTPGSITSTSEGVAASLLTLVTEITTNGDVDLDNVTLANGTSGQIKIFVVKAVGNVGDSVKITPATMVGGSIITFAASPLGLGCSMVYTSAGWIVYANNGGTIS